MKKSFNRALAGVSSLLVLAAAPRSWACGQGSSLSITNLPFASNVNANVVALNAAGQVAGTFTSSANPAPHSFIYTAGVAVDIGSLGGSATSLLGLNAYGQAVGNSENSDSSETLAFLYSSNAMLNLGTLGGGYSSATAINDAGLVVGAANLTGDAVQDAFLYSSNVMMDLGNLGGGASAAVAINNNGLIIGTSLDTNSNTRGFLYSGGVMVDLGDLGGGSTVPAALNDAGLIVGASVAADGNNHAFTYSAAVLTDLGTLGGVSSAATTVNTNSQVIGTWVDTNSNTRGFVYTGGVMTDLGNLGATPTTPHAINNLGQIVGDSMTTNDPYFPEPFLWQNGTMVDLNSLLPTNTDWYLISAQLINDDGRIVGYGFLGETLTAFVLDLGKTNSGSPTAVAGPNQTVNCPTPVTLDGSGSSEPGGSALTFKWTEGSVVLGTNSTISVSMDLGTHIITLTVTDPCGATGQANVTVQVVDTTPPTVSCPGAITVSAGANGGAAVPSLLSQVSASDNCTPTASLLITQIPVAGTIVGLGQTPIAVTVRDAAGNSAVCNTMFTVIDTTPPVIVSVPGPTTVSANANCEGAVPNVVSQVVATDNCTPANQLVITQSPAAGTLLGTGQHPITVTVKDASGNTATGTTSFTVTDTTPPVILSVPAPITVAAGNNCEATVPSLVGAVVATDNCTPPNQLVVTQSPAAGTLLGLGNHSIGVSVKDAAGNVATATVALTVADTTAPNIVSVPAPITVPATNNCEGVVPSVVGAVVATDNCTAASQLVVTQSPVAGTLLAPGNYSITVTVKDAAGNTATASVPLTITGASGSSLVIYSVTATPDVLWPPDGRLVPVKVSVVVTNGCGATPPSKLVCKIVSITCNEPTRPIDGDKDDPIQITGDLTCKLRAWRDKNGTGRVYTITVRCTDATGASSTATTTVTVPKHQDGDHDHEGGGHH
jgi:probable HAF family extracellular repeat protein